MMPSRAKWYKLRLGPPGCKVALLPDGVPDSCLATGAP